MLYITKAIFVYCVQLSDRIQWCHNAVRIMGNKRFYDFSTTESNEHSALQTKSDWS